MTINRTYQGIIAGGLLLLCAVTVRAQDVEALAVEPAPAVVVEAAPAVVVEAAPAVVVEAAPAVVVEAAPAVVVEPAPAVVVAPAPAVVVEPAPAPLPAPASPPASPALALDQVIYKGVVGNLLEVVPLEPEQRVQLQRTNAVVSNVASARTLAILLGVANPVLMIGGLVWGLWAASQIKTPEAKRELLVALPPGGLCVDTGVTEPEPVSLVMK